MAGGDPTHATHIPIRPDPDYRVTLNYAPPPAARARVFWSDVLAAWMDRHRRVLFTLLLGLYLLGFNPQWRLEPDSALYLSIGRNLVEGEGYTFHGKAHRLAYPGLPLALAGLFRAFGTRSLLPAQVFVLGLGLATLALVYRLVLLRADRPTAVVVTVGVGMSQLFYRYCFEVLTDLPFLFGVALFLAGYEALFHRRPDDGRPRARWFDGAFLAAGLIVAVTTRPAMWALAAAVVAAVGWAAARGGLRWGQVLAGTGVVAAVAAFYLHDPRHSVAPGAPAGTVYVEEDQMFQLGRARLAEMAARAGQNLLPVFDRQISRAAFGMPLGTPLNLVLDAVLVALGVALVRARPVWGLLVLTTVVMVLLVPKAKDRYFLPVLPLLVFAWWGGLKWVNRRLPARGANAAFALLFAVGAVPNGAHVFGFVYEQRYVPFLRNYKDGRYASVYEAARLVRDHTPPSGPPTDPGTTWVLVPPKFARVVTFLGRRNALEADDSTPLNPWEGGRWQSVYVLETSDPPTRDPLDKRPTVRQWLAARQFEVVPEPVATVPNKDPDATEPWTLHRIRPMPAKATASLLRGIDILVCHQPTAGHSCPSLFSSAAAP